MQAKKWLALILCAVMLCLSGCAQEGTAVYVQSVADLAGMGGIAPGDRFAGIVVSENVSEIKKDEDKAVKELFVKEGEDVKEGQELFSYDTDQLQLELDRKLLELEQLNASIENYGRQITELENERSKAASSEQLSYTVQIQTVQLDLKEAELNKKAKQTEVDQAKAILENASVTAPVSGRVQSISENGYDNYGNPLPYITIQQTGAYRIKGMIGELQLSSMQPGSRVRILSRTDETRQWLGTVTLVDYESPSQGGQYDMYYGVAAEEMTSASRYPFYVDPDSTEGLILGQHVYMEADTGTEGPAGLAIGSWFISYDENSSAYVWAENRSRLEKRAVTLGEYDPMTDTVIITAGLTEADYIAFPDPQLCVEGAPTTHTDNTMAEGGA